MSFREKTRDCVNLDYAPPDVDLCSQSETTTFVPSRVAPEAAELCLQGGHTHIIYSNLVSQGVQSEEKNKHPKPIEGLKSHAQNRKVQEVDRQTARERERVPCRLRTYDDQMKEKK